MESQLTPFKLTEIVHAVHVFRELKQFFLYVAMVTGSCDACLQFNGQLMTRREIEGRFGEYLEKVNDELWLPHVHPNCKCELHLWEEEE